MAEDTNTAEAGSNETKANPVFSIQRLYLKDASYEAPCMPAMLTKEAKPEINLDINTRVKKLNASLFEVVLRVTATAKDGDTDAFIIEVQHAGLFHIENMEEEQLQHTLGAFCPNILFPYVRETMDSLAVRGSLPPLTLAPVNFDAIYNQQKAQQQAQESQTAH